VVYAFDFESYFNEKEKISLSCMSVEQYLRHPDVDIYLMGIKGEDTEFCDQPNRFDWSRLPALWEFGSHNARFDFAVFRRLQETGVIPASVNPVRVHCTADMSSYLVNVRSLKDATTALLGQTASKEYRKVASGKHGWDFNRQEWGMIVEACRADVLNCYQLWQEYHTLWPEHEQILSEITRNGGMTGIHIDKELAQKYLDDLEALLRNIETEIPWNGQWQKDGKKTPLARKYVDAACTIAAIPAPLSMAKTDEQFHEWVEEHQEQAPWVHALKHWAGANRLRSVLQTAVDRADEKRVMTFGLKYFGAGTTGRWSGDSGYNMQNMLWKNFGQEGCPYAHVDHRGIHIPPPDHVFIVADYDQIEPRSLNAFVKNWKFLDACKSMSAYEAEAVKNGAWNPADGVMKKEDPAKYAYYKAQVLSCGYGAGWRKVVTMMTAQGMDPYKIVGDDASATEIGEFKGYLKWLDDLMKTKRNLREVQGISDRRLRMFCKTWLMVRGWRANNPDVTGFWIKMQQLLESHCGQERLFVRLPSGRMLRFYGPRKTKDGDIIAWTTPLKRPQDLIHLYGPKIVACSNQGNARDVLGHAVVRLYKEHGIPALFTAHDEGIFVAHKKNAEKAAETIQQVMIQPPAWMPHLPLSTTPSIVERYCK
jgi:hypothetical protein